LSNNFSSVHADFSGADLIGADFSSALLTRTNFSDAKFDRTVLADVDLSQALGLDSVGHQGPSKITISTIYLSQGNIPEKFLRGAGLPDPFIGSIKSLVAAAARFQFYSCFISYSSADCDFAERLHTDLQSRGVRCWFAPEDLKVGDRVRQSIDEAIGRYDKLLVVLSQNSVASSWVESEVEAAFEREPIGQCETALFPIRLDDSVMNTTQAWAADIRRKRHIGDFRNWKDRDSYEKSLQRLLRDLQGAR
jgi:hypothetical protein